ncbi:MAG: 23S rRNA (adenine(1618)-N(6))-methyltransferase RlmF [Bacteroidales bacterium]|nr:23S rRNA (adenine(1618)-N(6))-methyltransferase RlmF [Bacteroidales bacterium]
MKERLHPRNKHRGRYDFKQLAEGCPELTQFVKLNIYGDESIDFADPEAVKMLNKALLKRYYGIDHWDIPQNYLCPPIPGRADYIHYMADLLSSKYYGKIPPGRKIRCLDIGVGANCVYPIIGNREYGWSFTGADIDPVSIESSNKIIELNTSLQGEIELRLQVQPNDIFFGIIQKEEFFDLTICNPPFHTSEAEAQSGTLRKLNNLNSDKTSLPVLNFGGQNSELWCKGGELRFVRDMIRQSKFFAGSCFWFSTLISKQSHLKGSYEALEKEGAVEVKTIPMGQGNKSSRIVAWTFLDNEQQRNWINTRWKG